MIARAVAAPVKLVVIWALSALLLLGAQAPLHAQPAPELAAAWQDLGDESNDVAAAAAKTLAANPSAALDLLERELAPLPADPTPRIRELVAQFRAPRYAEREAAQKQLAVFGPLADSELNRLLAAGLGVEEKNRVESLLAQRVATFAATENDRRLVRTLVLVSGIDDPRARALSLALGPLRDWSIVDPQFPPLYAQLMTDDPPSQALAAVGIINLGEPALVAMPRFIELMGGDGPMVPVVQYTSRVGDHIARALPELGAPVVKPLLAAYDKDDDNAKRRERITSVLVSIHDPSALSTFVEVLDSREHIQVALVAARALANYKTDAVAPLLAALATGPADLRWAAANSLAAIGDPRAIAPIAVLLHDDDHNRRLFAVEDLRKFQDAAIGSAVEALRSNEPNLRGDAEARSRIIQFILANSKNAEAAAALVECLHDEQPEVRTQAIWGLRNVSPSPFRDPAVIEAMFAAVSDDNPRVRGAALDLLGDSDRTTALDKQRVARALLAALDDKDLDVRIDAVQALGSRRVAEAVDRLMPLLADDARGEFTTLQIRLAAAEALGNIGDARAIGPLRQLLKDKPHFRVIRALGDLHDRQSVPAIIDLLENGDEQQKRDAAQALGKIKDRRAVEPLIAALSGRGEIVNDAARALGEIRDPRAVAPLIELCRGGGQAAFFQRNERPFRASDCAATYPLEQMGLAAVEPLARALSDPNERCRRVAAYVLSANGSYEEVLDAEDMLPAIEPLAAALFDECTDVRFNAAHVLAWLHDERAAFPLVELLRQGPTEDDHEPYIFSNLGSTLSRLKTPAVVPDLIALLDDPRAPVRANAARAIFSYRDERAVEPMLAHLDDPDLGVRHDVARGLGRMKVTAAADRLIAMLKDPSPDIRAVAADSLGRIGDARAVEPLAALAQDEHGADGKKDDSIFEFDPRSSAAIALVRLHDARGAALIARRLNDEDPKLRERVATQLAFVTYSGVKDATIIPLMIHVLDDPEIRVRLYIATGLGEIGETVETEAATDALLGKLSDRENLRAVLQGLARIKTDRAYAPLVEHLADENEEYRITCAHELGESKNPAYIDPLVARLSDPAPRVRETVLKALTKLHATAAVPEITKLKSDDDPMVVLYAARALDRLQSQ